MTPRDAVRRYPLPFIVRDVRGRERWCVLVGDFRWTLEAMARQAGTDEPLPSIGSKVGGWKQEQGATRPKGPPVFTQAGSFGLSLTTWAVFSRVDIVAELEDGTPDLYPITWTTPAGELELVGLNPGETADLVCSACSAWWRVLSGPRTTRIDNCPRCAALVLEVTDGTL